MTTDVMPAPPAEGQNGSRYRNAEEKRLDELAAAANRHHKEHGLVFRTAITHARDAGRALWKAKKLVNHKGWGQWLEDNFDASAETARAYMRLAKGWEKLPKLERDKLTIADARKLLARKPGKKPPPGVTDAGSSRTPNPPPPATDTEVESTPSPAPTDDPVPTTTDEPTDGGGDPAPSGTYKPAIDESLKPRPDEDVDEFVVKLSVAEKEQVDKWMNRLQRKLGTPNRAMTLMEVVRRVYLQHFPTDQVEAQR